MASSDLKPPVSGKRVFLSGTSRVNDVISVVAKELPRLGLEAVWYRRPDFPLLDNNAMDTCIKVVKTCDRIILVLDERGGLNYPPSGTPITEAEFDAAHILGLSALIFIRNRVWHQSRVYHCKVRKMGRVLSDHEFADCCLDGDHSVYKLLEKLQHLKRDGKPAVPWISPFEFPADVVDVVRGKWLLSDDKQLDILEVLQDAITGHKPPAVKRSTSPRERALQVSSEFIRQAASLASGDQLALRRTWSDWLEKFAKGQVPPEVRPVVGWPGLFIAEVGEFIIHLRLSKDAVILQDFFRIEIQESR